jgi:hypothetical protein
MRTSAVCAVGAWIVVALIGVLWSETFAVIPVVIGASLFTLLAMAHLVAFVRRMAAAIRSARPQNVDGTSDQPLDWSRRELALAIGQLAALAIFGRLLWPKGVAFAQQPPPPRPCNGNHPIAPPKEIKISVCINKNNKKKEEQAKNETQGRAKSDAQKFADDECELRGPCSKKCVRKGDGYTITLAGCAEDTAVECEKNQEGWTCTWQVTDITCRCLT